VVSVSFPKKRIRLKILNIFKEKDIPIPGATKNTYAVKQHNHFKTRQQKISIYAVSKQFLISALNGNITYEKKNFFLNPQQLQS
jgi:hypothetical protein